MTRDSRDNCFFIIDSEHLDAVSTRMYGYSLDENGITTEQTFCDGRVPDPGSSNGAWLVIRRDRDEITITQDSCGSYGLYTFEKDGFFALSNSFVYLADHLKSRYALTLDTEYADYFLATDLCSLAYGRTMLREIHLLDRSAVVHISVADRRLSVEVPPVRLRKESLDSQEGMRILDRWYNRWTGILRSITQQSDNVTADLSGGFDSRITFMLLLCSGADLTKINIASIKDEKHTHPDDYRIASQIADHFGFRLNDRSMLRMERSSFTLDKAVALSSAVRLGFHKQFNTLAGPFEEAWFRITGAGGEAIRDHWDMTVDEFLAERKAWIRGLPGKQRRRYRNAHRDVLLESMAQIAKKYRINDPKSKELPQLIYVEERVRNHFGKDAVETWLVNNIKVTPLLDQDLRFLRQDTDACSDRNLLVAVILQRYCPELLAFPFDSGRSIAPDTLAYAAKISASWPEEMPDDEGPAPDVRAADDGTSKDKCGPCGIRDTGSSDAASAISSSDILQYWRDLFNSDIFQNKLRLYTGALMPLRLRRKGLRRGQNPQYHMYSSAAVVQMMDTVWESRDGHGCEGLIDRPDEIPVSRLFGIARRLVDWEVWTEKNVLSKIKQTLLKLIRR